MNHYILILGSNYLPNQHIALALDMLKNEFGNIRCSEIMQTEAIDMPNLMPFTNIAVCIAIDLPLLALKKMLKNMEKQIGRTDEDKAKGIIYIDIDLIMMNKKVLHSDYQTKKYVKNLVDKVCNLTN